MKKVILDNYGVVKNLKDKALDCPIRVGFACNEECAWFDIVEEFEVRLNEYSALYNEKTIVITCKNITIAELVKENDKND